MTKTKKHKRLIIQFGNFTMRTKAETELAAEFQGETEVNLVTALRFYRIFSPVMSLLNLEQRHETVTAIGVQAFQSVL